MFAIAVLSATAAGATDPKKTFNQRCTACHSFGKGVKVGPDLKGVTARRQRPWLLKFIRSSQTVIASGDPTAKDLFRQFGKQRMPDWVDLSPAELTRCWTGWRPTDRSRKSQTNKTRPWRPPRDVDRARALFEGRAQLASGGVACSACHTVATTVGGGAARWGPI